MQKKIQKNFHVNQFVCLICKKPYTQKSSLNRHFREKHSNTKGANCRFCGLERVRINDHEKRCRLKSLLYADNKPIFHSNVYLINNNNKAIDLPKLELKSLIELLPQDLKCKIELNNYLLYENIRIGNGGSMNVFYGTDKDSNIEVAIKIGKKRHSILCESFLLQQIKEIDNVPTQYEILSQNRKTILIESLFGPSLKKLLFYQKENFDVWSICEIGIQIIQILAKIHSKNWIHNDIKPANICWGRISKGNLIEKDKIFLIDFSMARKISSDEEEIETRIKLEGKNIPLELLAKQDQYEGTTKFMALAKGKGDSATKQTDLEELFYCLIFLFKGSLPWNDIDEGDHVSNCKKTAEIKESINCSDLCSGLPEEFIVLSHYIFNISNDENPCYNTIIELLNLCKEKNKNKEFEKNEFCFNRYIREKFEKYKNKSVYDSGGEETKLLFGDIPINKESLLY